MTKIDFYILEGVGASRPDLFSCRLLEKIYLKGHRCYVYQPESLQAKKLDQLLWSFREGSFVPHQQMEKNQRTDPARLNVISIGGDTPPAQEDDVLVNMALDVPLFFSRFHRLVEIVGTNPQQKEASRQRYRFYRDRGYPLESHQIITG